MSRVNVAFTSFFQNSISEDKFLFISVELEEKREQQPAIYF